MSPLNRSTKYDVKLFLASPGDVLEERALVSKVVNKLAAEDRYQQHFSIDIVAWDREGKQVAMHAAQTPQQTIGENLTQPKDCDLVVTILWMHMGTPLPSHIVKENGEPYLSGTEWEFLNALEGYRDNPDLAIWLYHRTEKLQVDLDDPQLDAKRQQMLAVKAFIDNLNNDDGSIQGGRNDYADPATFEREFESHLRRYLDAALASDGGTSLPKTVQTHALSESAEKLKASLIDNETIDSDLLETVYNEQPNNIEAYRLCRYAAWSRDQEPLQKRFVNLHLLVDHGIKHQQPRMEQAEKRYDDLQQLLQENTRYPAWALIGDPGCGKSTVLQHYELSLALRGIVEECDELCIWQRLSEYSIDDEPPAQWLAEKWRETWPDLSSLQELDAQYQLRFILDGLNEISVANDDDYRIVVRRWVDWAAARNKRGGAIAPLFSVRRLNHSVPFVQQDFSALLIKLERWSTDQIQQYIKSREGVEKLWPQIKNDKKLLEFSSLPINLVQQCELYTALQRPAVDRAELFGGLLWQRMIRAHERGELNAPGLLTTDDKRELTNPEDWTENLLHPPDQGRLLSELGRQAASMHQQGTEVTVATAEVATDLDSSLRDAWLKAVEQMNIVDRSKRGKFRFEHQSWQEYFAARGLSARRWDDPDDVLPKLAAPLPEALDETMADLSVGDELPGPGVSDWEESAKILVQLVEGDRRNKWFDELIRQNPPMAARAAMPLLDTLPKTSIDQLRQSLLSTSRDAKVDLRLRIEAGTVLGEIGDPRYVERESDDGIPYLVPIESHIVTIPAGRYPVGGNDADSEDDERTAEGEVPILDLDAFELCFAPVTNAEYRCFVDAGGYEDQRWWPGEAEAWRKGDNEQTQWIDFFRKLFTELRESDDIDSVVRKTYVNPTETNFDWCREQAQLSEKQGEERIQQWYGAKKYTVPQEWKNSSFNRPSQPLVGVCWFEAMAYCFWLRWVSGEHWTLPTEGQWQAAAAGEHGRRWPWGLEPAGDGMPDKPFFNADPAHLRKTSPVGVFPQADTLCDGDSEALSDMAGNVLEWCSSDYSNPLDIKLAAVESLAGDRRVLRGGGFHGPAVDARCARRGGGAPGYRDGYSGFRLVRVQ